MSIGPVTDPKPPQGGLFFYAARRIYLHRRFELTIDLFMLGTGAPNGSGKDTNGKGVFGNHLELETSPADNRVQVNWLAPTGITEQ